MSLQLKSDTSENRLSVKTDLVSSNVTVTITLPDGGAVDVVINHNTGDRKGLRTALAELGRAIDFELTSGAKKSHVEKPLGPLLTDRGAVIQYIIENRASCGFMVDYSNTEVYQWLIGKKYPQLSNIAVNISNGTLAPKEG